MRQVLFTIPVFGGLRVFGYGTMLLLAFLGSTNLAAWRAKREKLDPELLLDLAQYVFLGGLIGARVFYVVQYWGDRVRTVLDIFKVWEGGIVFYGSIIGGTAAFFLYWLVRRFPLRPLLDVVAPSLALGIALGRLGCFLNGCCYGDACDLPWAVRFPQGSPPWVRQVETGQIVEPNGSPPWVDFDDPVNHRRVRASRQTLPVHPTQLYSALDGLILLALLSAYYPIRRRDGEVMALLMVTYPVSRFLIEELRSDEGVFVAGMTISQFISVLLLMAGLAFWSQLGRFPATRLADEADERAPAEAVAAPAG
jgi:phosphatidylglycerol---prolipoprotein diacylglyceryl transferase